MTQLLLVVVYFIDSFTSCSDERYLLNNFILVSFTGYPVTITSCCEFDVLSFEYSQRPFVSCTEKSNEYISGFTRYAGMLLGIT